MSKKTINILGVTGSIGQAAADVILANSDDFDVRLVSAHQNADKLAEMAEALGAQRAVLTRDEDLLAALDEPVDVTLCAVSGIAGLPSMMRAIELSRAVAIANKEPLVAAGPQVMAAAREYDTQLLPVDSEHNAIFQVFDFERRSAVERIILTASGGPFLSWSVEEMARATPEQALQHPNWDMGRKITIDSATMMNKALEVIEAALLFDLPPEKIDVLVHPQSVVHSMVEYTDGSVLAQMGASDMRTPLANVLAWPERLQTPGQRLDLAVMARLDFEALDSRRFPAVGLAYDALRAGQYACIALNAANEVAVEHFLTKRIGFADIMSVVQDILGKACAAPLSSLADVMEYDHSIRAMTVDALKSAAA